MNNPIDESILLIFEKDLNDRYEFFVKQTNIDTIKLNLNNIFDKNPLTSLINRIRYRNNIISKIDLIHKECKNKKYIFVSNAEGFIALDIIKSIKNQNDAKIIALQHGIFEFIDWPLYKIFIKKIINFLTKIFFGIYVLGMGFGHKVTDKYIVYCKEYKEFLLKKGWGNDDVIISSFFLKNKTSDSKSIFHETRKDSNVLLIAQPMSASGMIKKEVEDQLYSQLLNVLLKKYEKIFIRQHPFEQVDINTKSEKIIETHGSTLEEDLDKASTVVSFMSTVLVDYEEMDKEFISVYSDSLEFYKSSYVAFKKIYFIDDDKDKKFDFILNSSRKRDFFYQKGVSEIDDLFKIITI